MAWLAAFLNEVESRKKAVNQWALKMIVAVLGEPKKKRGASKFILLIMNNVLCTYQDCVPIKVVYL